MKSRVRTRILAFSGPSGAGKTTLLVRLIPALVARGLSIAALKGSGHRHAFDRPGKDSARLRAAGAIAVAIQGPSDLAWFGPARSGGVRALARLLPPVDLVVVEGFRSEKIPRIEVHRRSVDERFLCVRDRGVIAVVGDEPPPRALPWFRPGDVDGLAELVARFARNGRPRKHALASSRTRAHRGTSGRQVSRGSVMATRKTGRTGRAGSSGRRRRTGGATVREAGRKGGRRTLERRGPEFYSRIGRKGGKSSGHARRGASRRRAAGTAGRSRSGTRRKTRR